MSKLYIVGVDRLGLPGIQVVAIVKDTGSTYVLDRDVTIIPFCPKEFVDTKIPAREVLKERVTGTGEGSSEWGYFTCAKQAVNRIDEYIVGRAGVVAKHLEHLRAQKYQAEVLKEGVDATPEN